MKRNIHLDNYMYKDVVDTQNVKKLLHEIQEFTLDKIEYTENKKEDENNLIRMQS